MPIDHRIAELAQVIDRARRAVVFTGAGISTESGIPDFRSPGGIWTKMAPIDFSDFLASEEARRETWRRRFEADDTWRNAQPNRGHRAVAELVRRGTVAAVITQNIDGLHQASGVPAEQVIELHGNSTYAHCLDCARRYEIAELRSAFERNGAAPLCGACGGWVKTATISFGQGHAGRGDAARRNDGSRRNPAFDRAPSCRQCLSKIARGLPRRASIFCDPPHAARFSPYPSGRQMQ
jgi:NAD-dependent deacetylase